MKVELLDYSKNFEKICASAAKSCYSKKSSKDIFEEIDEKDIEKVLKKIISMKHYSVLEHSKLTFSVSEVSRALTHQLVRHRIASYSQQSQRYVKFSNYEDLKFITPDTIIKKGFFKEYSEFMKRSYEIYEKFIKEVGAEDARYVLPNAFPTNITVTMNVRELLYFFKLRCCNRSQWEIRELADKMLEVCKEISPLIFSSAGPSCLSEGHCYEGEFSCGRPKK